MKNDKWKFWRYAIAHSEEDGVEYKLAVYKKTGRKILVAGYGWWLEGGEAFREQFGDELDDKTVKKYIEKGVIAIYDSIKAFRDVHKDYGEIIIFEDREIKHPQIEVIPFSTEALKKVLENK